MMQAGDSLATARRLRKFFCLFVRRLWNSHGYKVDGKLHTRLMHTLPSAALTCDDWDRNCRYEIPKREAGSGRRRRKPWHAGLAVGILRQIEDWHKAMRTGEAAMVASSVVCVRYREGGRKKGRG